MDIEIKTWLYDILHAINEIEVFFADRPKEFAVYQSDLRTKRAVERNIEIIGEAMHRILNKDFSLEFPTREKLLIRETESFMVMTQYRMI